VAISWRREDRAAVIEKYHVHLTRSFRYLVH